MYCVASNAKSRHAATQTVVAITASHAHITSQLSETQGGEAIPWLHRYQHRCKLLMQARASAEQQSGAEKSTANLRIGPSRFFAFLSSSLQTQSLSHSTALCIYEYQLLCEQLV